MCSDDQQQSASGVPSRVIPQPPSLKRTMASSALSSGRRAISVIAAIRRSKNAHTFRSAEKHRTAGIV